MNKNRVIIGLTLLFLFRLAYGLCSEFWFIDQLQVFLIGLKFYATHLWPYFGPDLVYTGTQIPGALLGLLVGLPLFVYPAPESSFIFVNLVTFAGLSFLAWYVTKRIGDLPTWFVWLFLMTSPWTLFNGTGVFNMPYILAFSCVFFVCFVDSVTIYSTKLIPEKAAFFLTGLSFGCLMQLHLSWALLLPFLGYNFLVQVIKDKSRALHHTLWVFLGLAIPLALLVPTFVTYGLLGTGGTEKNIIFNIENFKNIFTILARFLSFASFEVPYVLGPDTQARLAVLKNHTWMIPAAVFLLPVGIAQVLFYIYGFFKKPAKDTDVEKKIGKRILIFFLSSYVLIFTSFFFSIKGPASHAFYLMLPVAMFYAFYAYRLIARQRYFQKLALVYFVAGFIFNTGLMVENYSARSIYKDREKIQRAIDAKDYRLLGIRRSDIWGRGY